MNNYRILLVETPNRSLPKYILTKKKYENNLYEFHKRFLKFKTKIGNQFRIYLIGFDKKIKHTYKSLIIKKIFSDIEKMPMGNLRKKLNMSLYADYNKKTTTPGLGFKDETKAKYTVNKIKDRDIAYQRRVLVTMINRAKYHPHKTNDMKKAIQIFEKRMEQLKN